LIQEFEYITTEEQEKTKYMVQNYQTGLLSEHIMIFGYLYLYLKSKYPFGGDKNAM
jgi:hypothetical protein